ncbi:MAG: 2-dehydro-3-deoxygluconokinase/2-dehydro-3-deoxygalactonokinase [Promethearchaeota archaeon]|nr:MAG: 2-dehydro-3-deoxygluconokinase/2-dehydro-3-deoxygalactonokinase [Candidatus Lokiarchaeota archaeon]
MSPDIISLGELLVEIMRPTVDVPHGEIGEFYKGPYPSGAPAIFIDSAARMAKHFNMTTGYVGVVGDDEFGRCIIEKMERDDIDISQIRIDSHQTTGIAFNQYNSDGSRKFIFAAGAAGETSVKDVSKNYFTDIKALHIMGSALSISEQSREACYRAIKIAKDQNPDVVISFDPNLRPEMLDIEIILEICEPVLEQTTILLPSGEEAEMLARVEGSKEACLTLLNKGPDIVVLKQGSDGSTIFSKDNEEEISVSSFKVEEKDPTGAGDSFGGAFIVGLLQGWDLQRIGKFANAVGALKVETFGPMTDHSYEDVIRFMEDH